MFITHDESTTTLIASIGLTCALLAMPFACTDDEGETSQTHGETSTQAGSGETGDPPQCSAFVLDARLESRWEVSLSPDLVDALGLAPSGDQVRILLDGLPWLSTHVATSFGEVDTIGLNAEGFARLGVEPGDCAFVATKIAPVELSAAQAEAQHDLIETLEVAGLEGPELLILAPHGGEIELRTEDIASGIADLWPFESTTWIGLGFGLGGGDAFGRLHVGSDMISFASFPLLEQIEDLTYARVVSIHGYKENGYCGFDPNTEAVAIGGRAPAELLELLRDNLDDALLAHSVAVKTGGKCSGSSPNNLVNRFSPSDACGGIQLELSPDVRADAEAREEIALVIRDTLLAWPGCVGP